MVTPFEFEKRYCHLLGADGTVLIVIVAQLRLAMLRWVRLAAECHFADGTGEQDACSVGPLTGDGEVWTFRGGRLTAETLAWDTSRIGGTLRFVPRHERSLPRDPLLARGRGRLRWIVEEPDAEAEAELRVAGRRLVLRGRAYRDYLTLDMVPSRLGLDTLCWGHAAGPAGATWWLALRSRRETIEATWRDGRLTMGYDPPPLTNVRTLVDRRIADLPVVGVPPLRHVARWLVGNPHQQRWVASARVAGHEALAVHERVRWRAGGT